jgi:hypothetical protein
VQFPAEQGDPFAHSSQTVSGPGQGSVGWLAGAVIDDFED